MTLKRSHSFDESCISGCVTNSPSGHGVSFGNTIDDNGTILYFLGDRSNAEVFLSFIDQLLVNFIGNNIEVMFAGKFCELCELFFCIYSTGRVVRCVDHDRFCFRCDGFLDTFHVEGETVFLTVLYEDRSSTGKFYHLDVADPARSRDDNLVTFFTEGKNCIDERLFCAGSDTDLVRFVNDIVVF